MLVVLGHESVVKLGSRAPEEFDPELPGWLGLSVEVLRLEPQILEKVTGESCRRAFTHTDNTNIRAAQNRYFQLRQASFESHCRNESGAAASQNNNFADGGRW